MKMGPAYKWASQHDSHHSYLATWHLDSITKAWYCMPVNKPCDLSRCRVSAVLCSRPMPMHPSLGRRVKDAQVSSDVNTAVQLPDIDRQPAHHPRAASGMARLCWTNGSRSATVLFLKRAPSSVVTQRVSLHAGNHAAKTSHKTSYTASTAVLSKKGTRTTDVTDPLFPSAAFAWVGLYERGHGAPVSQFMMPRLNEG